MTDKTDRSALSLGDIKLLMENYQNMIQLNTILLEQQKQVVDLQHQLMQKQDNITSIQKELQNKIDNFESSLRNNTDVLNKTDSTVREVCGGCESNLHGRFDAAESLMGNWKLEVTKQHGTINRNIIFGWIGMGTIAASLVGLAYMAYEKYALVDQIKHMVEQLLQYFGIG